MAYKRTCRVAVGAEGGLWKLGPGVQVRRGGEFGGKCRIGRVIRFIGHDIAVSAFADGTVEQVFVFLGNSDGGFPLIQVFGGEPGDIVPVPVLPARGKRVEGVPVNEGAGKAVPFGEAGNLRAGFRVAEQEIIVLACTAFAGTDAFHAAEAAFPVDMGDFA